MLHCTTFLAPCLAILVQAGNYFQIASFYWSHNRNIAREVARGMLYCAIAKNVLQCKTAHFSKYNLILICAKRLAWHITP